MDTRNLLSGLIGFFIGGLLVAIAATTFDKPSETKSTSRGSEMTMSDMTASLVEKSGDDYDKAFIESMIAHHRSAVDMAKLSPSRAKHEEIKRLSRDIIAAQEKEIGEMQQWQLDWGYTTISEDSHNMH